MFLQKSNDVLIVLMLYCKTLTAAVEVRQVRLDRFAGLGLILYIVKHECTQLVHCIIINLNVNI